MTSDQEPLATVVPASLAELRGAFQEQLHQRLEPLSKGPLGSLAQRLLPPLAARAAVRILHASEAPSTFTRTLPPAEPLVNTSWAVVLQPPQPDLSREQAAVGLVFAALRIRQRIAGGDWEPDRDQGEPLDSRTYHNVFSRCIVPELGDSYTLRDSNSKFFVVLVRGRGFRVDLAHNGQLVSRASLLRSLRQCVAMADAVPAGPFILTAAPCAQLRDAYPELCAQQPNLTSLRSLSEALFILCLDEGEPSSDEEAGFLLHAGNPENRWYTHGLQFVVFRNGQAGAVGSFVAGLEGQPMVRVMSEMVAAWAEMVAFEPKESAPLARLRPLDWQSVDRASLDRARAFCDQAYRRAPENVLSLGLRPQEAALLGLDQRRAFHFLLQAAILDQFGDIPDGEIIQIVGLRHFEGMTFGVHPLVSGASRAFGRALLAGESRARLQGLLKQATSVYSQSLLEARSVWDQEELFRQTSVRLARSPWRLVVRAAMRHVPTPRELFRLSLLRPLPGLRLFGRFGVHSNVPTSVWAHPIFSDDGTLLVCAPGPRAVVSPPLLRPHFERALERLRSAT